MINTIAYSKEILSKEKKTCVYIPSKGDAIIIGDLHGDIDSLSFILKNSNFNKTKYLIFLGDYGDRGKNSSEVYYFVLKLKCEFPEKIILLRGNHEFLPGLEVYPHDLPFQLKEKFGSEWKNIYQSLKDLWEYLYFVAIVEKKYLFLHGGLPVNLNSLDEIEKRENQEEILWNDPEEISGWFNSPRGAGKIFGKNVTERVLNKIRVKTLIRSHQPPAEGIKVSHEGRVLTISSTKVYGGKAAYLKLNLEEKSKDAYELSKVAYKF
jgi:protein phosphatase